MNNFKIKLADIIISAECRYDYSYRSCRDYIVDSSTSAFSVFPTDADIASENHHMKEPVPDDYAEFVCLHRKIAEQLPKYNRLVMHGAVITYKESALLFVAPSGTGKSTHIRLWKTVFPDDVDIINGDKPIVSIKDTGITIYGTPWAGKEGWHKNRNAPLKAICILKQSKQNRIEKIQPTNYLAPLLKQIYMPVDSNSLKLTLELFNKLIAGIPIYTLECDISQDAVITAYNSMIGNSN